MENTYNKRGGLLRVTLWFFHGLAWILSVVLEVLCWTAALALEILSTIFWVGLGFICGFFLVQTFDNHQQPPIE